MNDQSDTFDPCEALTVKEVAEKLHVSRPTVEKWIKSGELPSLELGGCRRILRSDLETFIAGRRCYGFQPLQQARFTQSNTPPPPPGDDIPF